MSTDPADLRAAPPPADPPEEYLDYFRHFARGEYFECHEVLERLWLRDKNRFYQALIQLAVALYHLSRGNTEGGRKLLAAAEEKLREYPPGHMGLDTLAVADWCADFRAALPPDRRHGPPVRIDDSPFAPAHPVPGGEGIP